MSLKSFSSLLAITAITLISVALYNGFPLIAYDATAYIEQAIYPHFGPERSPVYGLLMRLTSLKQSLWFTIIAQSALLSYVLLRFISYTGNALAGAGKKESDFTTSLLTVVVVAAFTGVSWVVSLLTPAIFAAILLLATFLFIYEAGNIRSGIIYGCIILTAVSVHNSSLLVLAILAGLLMVRAAKNKDSLQLKKGMALLAICGMYWGGICGANAVKKHGFVFSRGKDIFTMARLTDMGILPEYLDGGGRNKGLQMAKYRAGLPQDFEGFLWSGESPLYKMGGWDSSSAEYKTIAADIFTTPKYLRMYAQKTAITTIKELSHLEVPDKVMTYGYDTDPWKKVKAYFPHQLSEYVTSLQNAGKLHSDAGNLVYDLFFVLSVIWLLFHYSAIMNSELRRTYGFILTFFVINAFVTAAFLTDVCRLQYHIAWVLPATNAIIIVRYYFLKYAVRINTKPQPGSN